MACTQIVRVTYDKKRNPTSMKLICTGNCADKTPCGTKEETNAATGITKEFCACNGGKGDESEDCHIVLYTVRKHGKVVDRYFECVASTKTPCEKKKTCAPVPVGNGSYEDDPEKLEWMEFECECVSEDEVWPKK